MWQFVSAQNFVLWNTSVENVHTQISRHEIVCCFGRQSNNHIVPRYGYLLGEDVPKNERVDRPGQKTFQVSMAHVAA